MKTLAVNAVKSNNSYVNFAGKNKKSAKKTAVKITIGTLAVVGAGFAVYKNKNALSRTGENFKKWLTDFKLDFNSKFMHLKTLKWMQS